MFRGFCTPRAAFTRVFALFNEKKPQIYALYDVRWEADGSRHREETLKYFDDCLPQINVPTFGATELLEAVYPFRALRGPG